MTDSRNPSVPNVKPDVHFSSSGKRYCDHCGQRLIENDLHKHDTYRGEMKLPILRTRSNLETVFVSEGVVAKSITVTTVGFTTPTTAIARIRDLEIGQLPKGSIRAHINIRDIAYTLQPNAGTLTTLAGFLYYKDVQSVLHVIAAIGAAGFVSTAPQAFSVWNDSLISDSILTDGAPPDLGTFVFECTQLTLGTSASVLVDIRANIAALFEV